MLPVARYSDPSPSRFRYRFERLWLKSSVRQVVRIWLPLAIAGGAFWVASNDPVILGGVE